MLQYFAIYSPTIGFPELAYPSLARVCYISISVFEFLELVCILNVQLRKVCKSVSFSWLRLQLKQLIEKVGLRMCS